MIFRAKWKYDVSYGTTQSYFHIFFSYKTPCKNICQFIEKCNQCNKEWSMGFLLGNITTWSSSLVLNMVGGWVGLGCGCKNIDMTCDKTYLLIRLRFNSLTMLQLFEFVSPTCFVDFFVKLWMLHWWICIVQNLHLCNFLAWICESTYLFNFSCAMFTKVRIEAWGFCSNNVLLFLHFANWTLNLTCDAWLLVELGYECRNIDIAFGKVSFETWLQLP
jgi:hypothetical protein